MDESARRGARERARIETPRKQREPGLAAGLVSSSWPLCLGEGTCTTHKSDTRKAVARRREGGVTISHICLATLLALFAASLPCVCEWRCAVLFGVRVMEMCVVRVVPGPTFFLLSFWVGVFVARSLSGFARLLLLFGAFVVGRVHGILCDT